MYVRKEKNKNRKEKKRKRKEKKEKRKEKKREEKNRRKEECLHLQYLIVSLKSDPTNGILFHFSIKANVMWQVPLASHWESDRHYAPSCDVEILCSQWTRRDALVRFSRHSAEWFCESNVGGKFCVAFVKAILLALQSPIKTESRTTKLRQDDSHRKGRSGCSHVMWCRRMCWYGVYRLPSNLQLLVSSFNLMLFPFCTFLHPKLTIFKIHVAMSHGKSSSKTKSSSIWKRDFVKLLKAMREHWNFCPL